MSSTKNGKRDLLAPSAKPDLSASGQRDLLTARTRDLTAPTPSPIHDPLANVEYPGNVEGDAQAEIGALESAFLSRAKNEEKRRRFATDSEYWCCLCFESREQKETFLRALDWIQHGDKYLDGLDIAAQMKIPLPDAQVPYVKSKPDAKLDALSLPLD